MAGKPQSGGFDRQTEEQTGGRHDQAPAAPAAPQPATEAKQPEPTTDIYHVVGPGPLLRVQRIKRPDGRVLKQTVAIGVGELVELTPEEAKSLGKAVALGEPPPPPPPASERKAGRYRIRGPGSVMVKHKLCRPGEVIDLSAEDAQGLGDQVESA